MNPPSYGQSSAGASNGDHPVCPRHPDRVSYMTCKRCHQPMCHGCQVATEVGSLCVDCMQEINRAQRGTMARTAVGGRGHDTPMVTYVIMGICIVLFALQTMGPFITPVHQWLMFAPFRALQMPWTFITSGFLHGGVLHLALNMYALWVIGQYLERALGRWRFTALFLLSVIGGHVAVLLLSSPLSDSWVTGTVGASGGIFGLFGALFVVQRKLGGQATQVLVLIGANLVITFLYPNISWQGHLGGLVTGTALAAAFFATRPTATPGADREALGRKSAMIHAGVCAAMAAVLVVLVIVKALMALSSGVVLIPGLL